MTCGENRGVHFIIENSTSQMLIRTWLTGFQLLKISTDFWFLAMRVFEKYDVGRGMCETF